MKFQQLIKTIMLKNIDISCFLALRSTLEVLHPLQHWAKYKIENSKQAFRNEQFKHYISKSANLTISFTNGAEKNNGIS